MVCLAENPRALLASCCRVEVVNGGRGLRLVCFFSKSFIVYFCFSKSAIILFTCSAFFKSILSNFLFATECSLALKIFFSLLKTPSKLQYSSVLKALISRSRSTIKRTATDCTRPADSPLATLRHRNGDSS